MLLCRYYRRALELAIVATESWSRSGVGFVCQLGDIIDGQNKENGTSEEALRTVEQCSRCSVVSVQSVRCGLSAVWPRCSWCVLVVLGVSAVWARCSVVGAVGAVCSEEKLVYTYSCRHPGAECNEQILLQEIARHR